VTCDFMIMKCETCDFMIMKCETCDFMIMEDELTFAFRHREIATN
jgi:hypothetical protein